jgi:hypothetical protein
MQRPRTPAAGELATPEAARGAVLSRRGRRLPTGERLGKLELFVVASLTSELQPHGDPTLGDMDHGRHRGASNHARLLHRRPGMRVRSQLRNCAARCRGQARHSRARSRHWPACPFSPRQASPSLSVETDARALTGDTKINSGLSPVKPRRRCTVDWQKRRGRHSPCTAEW